MASLPFFAAPPLSSQPVFSGFDAIAAHVGLVMPGQGGSPVLGEGLIVAGLAALLVPVLYAILARGPYPRASPATPSMRSTIARRPFDRWADRWFVKPSRPNSARASTAATSASVSPP